MRLNKFRRSQLIAPFGPGALHILKQGIAVITAGLDHWGKSIDGSMPTSEQKERMKIREPRLERKLQVSHFRLAPGPDTRIEPNDPELVTPLLRFPTWYVCPKCHGMLKEKLHRQGWVTCGNDSCNRERMNQVRFAAVCEHGHLQDFPWMEWVHRTDQITECSPRDLSYNAGGSGSLGDIYIKCKKCGMQRNLQSIMHGGVSEGDGNLTTSVLTRELYRTEKGKDCPPYNCQGSKPWLGEDIKDVCHQSIRGILINATNAHFGNVKSAIRLPFDLGRKSLIEIRKKFSDPRFRSIIRMHDTSGYDTTEIVDRLRKKMGDEFPKHSDNEIRSVVEQMRINEDNENNDEDDESSELAEYDEAAIRREEYPVLNSELNETGTDVDLIVRKADMKKLPVQLKKFISDISLVEKLKETRVLSGFSRLLYNSPNGAPHPQKMLWREWPKNKKNRWLPACIVNGEGILITLDDSKLTEWENRDSVAEQIKIIQKNYDDAALKYRWDPRDISARLILTHSFSHALINELVFECGYSSASLRERIYIEKSSAANMTGVMIYTASGDSEGSMGGLVRMGEPDKLGEIIYKALNKMTWCGGDPVCGEAKDNGGQGPDSLNLAACRSCLLLPETSCEEFNRFLDRSFLTGVLNDHTSGFFSGLIS